MKINYIVYGTIFSFMPYTWSIDIRPVLPILLMLRHAQPVLPAQQPPVQQNLPNNLCKKPNTKQQRQDYKQGVPKRIKNTWQKNKVRTKR